MNPNPDYIDCDKDETTFQWGDGNLIYGFDPSFKESDKSTTARYRFEGGNWVLMEVLPQGIKAKTL